ncbi:MAG TPA: two-component regulator propeller domain-containing protein, partial [Calditrichia bacterium]|nr:two-component regulator propeller domain-containing protein [Calditrichia bacterium]
MAVHFVSLTFRLLIFLALPLVAQTQPLRFTHLTTDQGLSQSNITSILQDNRGYLWFGTFNGLNRFDGYQFEVFNYADDASGSISHNFISALTLDPDGNLWVGTSEGLNRFDEEKNRFTVYENKPGDPRSIIDDQIEAIWSDANGRLWIGTRNGGLDLFDPQTESFAHHFHDPGDSASLSSNRIATLFEDSDGNLWIGHWNGSVDIYHRADRLAGQFRVERRRLAGFPITAIGETPDR